VKAITLRSGKRYEGPTVPEEEQARDVTLPIIAKFDTVPIEEDTVPIEEDSVEKVNEGKNEPVIQKVLL